MIVYNLMRKAGFWFWYFGTSHSIEMQCGSNQQSELYCLNSSLESEIIMIDFDTNAKTINKWSSMLFIVGINKKKKKFY